MPSTFLNPSTRCGRVTAAATCCAWLAACAVAWDSSATSGMRSAAATEAERIAGGVAGALGLEAECSGVAARLAEADLRARNAEGRPFADGRRAALEASLAGWDEAGCPREALLAIAWGVSVSYGGTGGRGAARW